MAAAAKTHIQRLGLLGHYHILDLAMAKCTDLGDPLYRHVVIIKNEASQVFFMGKMDEVRDIMNLLPPGWLFLFPVLCQCLDTLFVCCDNGVATHTFARRRYSGHLAASCIGMAVHAVYLVDFRMDVMREFDRLLDVLARIGTDRRHSVRHRTRGTFGKGRS